MGSFLIGVFTGMFILGILSSQQYNKGFNDGVASEKNANINAKKRFEDERKCNYET